MKQHLTLNSLLKMPIVLLNSIITIIIISMHFMNTVKIMNDVKNINLDHYFYKKCKKN